MSTTPERLDDLEIQKTTPANIRFISTTDPDASVTRHSSGKSKLRYKTHRAVDERCEVITATKITPGSVDDSHVLKEMFETHEQNTQKKANTAVGESKYGTIERCSSNHNTSYILNSHSDRYNLGYCLCKIWHKINWPKLTTKKRKWYVD